MKDKPRPSASSGYSILIVDDDESTCKTLTLIFNKKGYETETAGTGREALEKAQGGFFNLALLDIKLTDMKGAELIEPLKEIHPDMDVIIVTAHASLENVLQALNEGVSAYITKPLNMDEVLAAVSRALEKQYLVMEKRQAEKKIRNLMENVPVGITLSTPEEGVIEANPAVYKMFGYDSQEDFLKIPASAQYYDPKDRQQFVAKLDKEGAVKDFEARFKRKDGTIFWGSASSITQIAETGAAQFINVFEDITEQKKAANAIRESEEKFRLLAENSVDCIWKLDTKLRFTYLSPSSEVLLGYKPEQMVGTKLSSYFTKREFLKAGALAASAIRNYKTSSSVNFETKMINSKNEEVNLEISSKVLLNRKGKLIGLQGTTRDINEWVQARQSLKESEKHYRLLAGNVSDIIWTMDMNLKYIYISPSTMRMTGFSVAEAMSLTLVDVLTPDSLEVAMKVFMEEMAGEEMEQKDLSRIITMELEHYCKDGSTIWTEVRITGLRDSADQLVGIQGVTRDITERKQAKEEERRHFQDIGFLAEHAISFVDFPPDKDIYRFVGEGLKVLAGESIVVVNSIDKARGILTNRAVLGMGKYSKGILELIGRNPEGMEYDASDRDPAYLSDGRLHDYQEGLYGIFLGEVPEPACRAIEKLYRLNKIYTIGFIKGKKIFGTAAIFLSQGAELENKEIIETFVKQASIAIQRQQAQVALQHRNREMALLNRVTAAASTTLAPKTVLETTCRELALAFDLPMAAAAILNDARTGSVVVAEYLAEGYPSALDVVIPLEGNPATRYVMEHKSPLAVVDAQHDPRMAAIYEPLQKRGTVSMLILPLIVRGQVVGTLGLDSVERREFSSEEIDLVANVVNTAAQALENARLFSQANQRLKRMEALRAIDKAILASVDINLAADIFLDQALTQLEVDAVDVLLFNPILQTLECIGRKGFRTSALKYTHLRLGEGQAGQVALKREIKYIPDLRKEEEAFLTSPDLSEEEFVAYYGVPLVAKGMLKGVLEIFHRAPLSLDDEWLRFLNTLAGQAAIAIDNASMFSDLQHSNLELGLAYDSTLEGWARALELRDMETEGHSRRVTEMVMNLARTLGVGKEELAHLYRGALLHDIGKMGVPDSILNKPGPLTDEEWVIMHQHPVYAHDMLSPIEYLRPALDIPYCHHEKWDGTGYPRGLKGEDIPKAARIFAIVDVWDALNSDRPYRKAWSKEKVIAHIKEQSGKHFDPQVVEAFLNQVI